MQKITSIFREVQNVSEFILNSLLRNLFLMSGFLYNLFIARTTNLSEEFGYESFAHNHYQLQIQSIFNF